MLRNSLLLHMLVLVLGPATGIDYCKDVGNDCGGGNTNIVCRRNNKCTPKENCVTLVIHEEIKQFIVDRTNVIRNNFAKGGPPVSGKPVANMQTMSWNKELAYIARCAVNVCENRLKGACPVSQKYSFGHIIYTNQMMATFDDELDFFEQAFDTWEEGGRGMTPGASNLSNKQHDYSGIIVAKSTAVGCGWSKVKKMILYHGYNGHFYFAACVFAMYPQAQNLVNDKPCKKCPRGTACNGKYTALCGDIQYAARGDYENADYYYGYSAGVKTNMRVSLGLLLVVLLAGFHF